MLGMQTIYMNECEYKIGQNAALSNMTVGVIRKVLASIIYVIHFHSN